MLLSIFNNGSGAWILLILMIIWGAIWGYRSYVSHKSGYHKQLPDGKWIDIKGNFFRDNKNFWFLVMGLVGLLFFMLWINADYR